MGILIMFPRVAGTLGKPQQPLQLLGVEPDDHGGVHHDGRSGPALVVLHQLAQSLRVLGDVLQFELDAAGREKLPRRGAGGSARLRVEDHLVPFQLVTPRVHKAPDSPA